MLTLVLTAVVLAASPLGLPRASPNRSFASESVEIGTSPRTSLLRFSNMAPGDAAIADLTIHNRSAHAVSFDVAASADNVDGKNLREQMTLTIKTKTGSPCSVFDGVTIYSGPLNPSDGELLRGQPLQPSASEVLCFKVELRTAAPNTVQAAVTTATFTFTAQETVNNS